MTTSKNSIALETGRAALARGAWEEASRTFAAGLKHEESAGLLEGLGWAQWWLNQTEEALQNRERAYQLLRQSGDLRGAARVATALAVDTFDLYGEPVARGWLERARRLLEGSEASAEFGRLALWEGHFALVTASDTVTAGARAADAARVAKALGLVDLEMMAVALEGLTLVSSGQVAEGMRRLDEATAAAVAGEMTDLDTVAQTCCLLIHACTRVQDYERATLWSRRIGDFCRRWRIGPLFAVCRTQFAAVLTMQGQWTEAENELEAAMQELVVTRPALVSEAQEWLGELRRRQGRDAEAAALFSAAEPRALALCGRGLLAFETGDLDTAAGYFERCLRRAAPDSFDVRAVALERLVRIGFAAGRESDAIRALEELEQLADRVGTRPLRALAAVARGDRSRATGDDAAARRYFEDAVDLFEACGAPYEAALARLDLADGLRRLGLGAPAKEEEGKAIETFTRLGAVRLTARARAAGIAAPAVEAASSGALTARECQVLRLVAEGLGDKEVADRLSLSEHTVHRHISNILNKLDMPSRAAAVAHALRNRLI